MDLAKFRQMGHDYPKLEPSKGKATEAEMAESEGTLHKAAAGEKRFAGDFALWKKSKAGEPSWESPWGGGRPGWHIECSVMASDLMGNNMDVHAGGSDLKFPHHDNELCQSEAFHGCSQWVNHFWHFGPLVIKGLKMSKSLKNFITIRQALESFTARQIRLFILLQPWDKRVDFSDQTVNEAKTKEATLLSYFGEVKAVLRQGWLGRPTSWGERERELHEGVLKHQAGVHACLCDNFNTAGAMGELLSIVSEANAYRTATSSPDALLLKRGAMYVTKILRVFGVITQDDFGFPLASGSGDNYEAQVGPIVEALVRFRDEVRATAKASSPPLAKFLQQCDALRDSTLVELGVRVEDKGTDGGAVWKLDDPETLRKELREKLAMAAQVAAEKLRNKVVVKAAELTKALSASVPPSELFTQPQFAGKYGAALDASGKPTTDAKGEALSKAEAKKIDSAFQKQQKEYTKHEEALKKSPTYIEDLKSDLASKQADVRAFLDKEAANLSEELQQQMRAALSTGA